MVQLRADPWRPDFGMGAEVGFEEEMTQAVVDPGVETLDWSRAVAPPPCDHQPVVFVDGVMRTELRVMAAEGDRRAWGLLGSFAAGGVRCDGAANFVAEDEPIGRALLLGGRVEGVPVSIDIGRSTLVYRAVGVTDDSPTGLRRSLQRLMLAEEQRLAAKLAHDTLVFADGPLHLDASAGKAPVVGVVKRMVSAYLTGEHADLLPKLRPGERTPLFALGNGAVDRFAWYLRLIPQDRGWHELAGLVRCEVRMEIGLGKAAQIADEVACHLPSYAGRPGVDPRAPQNLTPVGALEGRLKHRLGSSTVIGRALLTRLAEDNGDG
ncbi:MAG: DNA double-strand break repair nuclease NurA [Actinomycetota bacterium]